MKLQKNEKRLLKIMATVFVVGGIAVYYLSQPPEFKAIPPRKGLETSTEKPSESPAPTNTASPSRGSSRGSSRGGGSGDTSSSSLGSIGVSTFESRNTAKSCWVLIEGEVYDITGYLMNLVDVESASQYCGTFGFREGYIKESQEVLESVIRQSILMGRIG